MQYPFTLVAIAAIASLVNAQSIPDCAKPCLATSVAKVTKCAITDNVCQCIPANTAAISADAAACVIKSCSTSDALAAQAAGNAICAALATVSSSSVTPIITTSAPAVMTSSVSVLPTVAPKVNATTTSTTAQYTGAAGRVIAGLGSAAGLAIAAFAAL